MWTIDNLKARGKLAFKANYWPCVLVALILMAIVGVPAGRAGSQAYETSQQTSQILQSDGTLQSDSTLISPSPVEVNVRIGTGTAAAGGLVGLLLGILVINPLAVGCYAFFKKNSEFGPTQIDELKTGFVPSWGRNVLAMFLTGLFTALWTLLFIIPGLVKMYSYRLVPYILADDPNIEAAEAITLSRQMMDGNKGRAFLLDLSFIGWILLTIITLGFAGIFYVNPYKSATDAELYLAIREEYTNR